MITIISRSKTILATKILLSIRYPFVVLSGYILKLIEGWWWAHRDLNPGPIVYETTALTD
jgi:hypothetical protein